MLEHRLVGSVDKQVILGDVCELHEIRTQGPDDRDVRSDIKAVEGCPSLNL